MKFQFKTQDYQSHAVQAVVDCFADNADKNFSQKKILNTIREVQRHQNLPLSEALIESAGCPINLDIEMETGTGKTYCYIKTIFELNKHYGWKRFIIVVPSIAIREGVAKSFEMTAEHFLADYGRRVRFFIYNSSKLHNIGSFADDAGINVMIINIQAFNARGADNRRIYEEQDSFGSRRPIDVLAEARPVVILDEPQKMSGKATLDGLEKFKPRIILRYSATHKVNHNKIYRLDALDAYNQKLVKKIAVRGISVKGLSGTNAYLYLEGITISKSKPPVARMELEIKRTNSLERVRRILKKGDNLFETSNGLEQYRGFIIAEIDAVQNRVEFTNGATLAIGEATGDVTETMMRRIQIRETIRAHLEKEEKLFRQEIKVLSLFFIDEVAKYRDYSERDEKGEYARIFEEEYEQLCQEILSCLPLESEGWRAFLTHISAAKTHAGYFSIDKRTKHLIDPEFEKRGENAGLSRDVDAYDLILKDKERLLSFAEPVRFIFSHSALREGWDNPNIFTICMLKHSDSTISRRQEVGRGLRLCVNSQGERMDDPAFVHDINILSVVVSESYQDFVENLQKEISASLSSRPRLANKEYFIGQSGITESQAGQIYRWLVRNYYTNDDDTISELYHQTKREGTIAPLPDNLRHLSDEIFTLIDGLFSETALPNPRDENQTKKINHLNANFEKREFQELWARINKHAIYRVNFDSSELVKNSIAALQELRIAKLHYSLHSGQQLKYISDAQLEKGEGFVLEKTRNVAFNGAISSNIKYDLIGKIAANVELTRKTVAEILMGIDKSVFDQFKQNPEYFIMEASRLINEQKASRIVEELTYDSVGGAYDANIFTAGQENQIYDPKNKLLKKHILNYLITDSNTERDFAENLEAGEEVVVYAKLPKSFKIPTPVGNYNPDWAIAFEETHVKHVYFVAETKGSLDSMQLRKIEAAKIACAEKFFELINKKAFEHKIHYKMVSNFAELQKILEYSIHLSSQTG